MMDWLNQAAENAKKEKDSSKKWEEKLQQLKAAYPDYRMQLWLKFDSVFRLIAEKFGSELTSIKVKDDYLVIKIAEVTIEATAEQQALMGGYFASVDVDYKVSNASGGPNLPYNRILLTNDGKWVYLDRSSHRPVNIEFGEEQIVEIFKTALWKYIK